jgi:hypothetical protein
MPDRKPSAGLPFRRFACGVVLVLCAAVLSSGMPGRGAVGEEGAPKSTDLSVPLKKSGKNLWSLRPVVRPPVPAVANGEWARNPVDRFILSRLEGANLAPSAEADRATLIRRLSFDLVGLPPAAEEVEAFVGDPRPDAYEQLVERLLASPRYGERWARHWLDLVHYAESDGYKADVLRPGAWRYRDYVIRAHNADKSYDRFLMEQLAGDELFPEDGEAMVATGYLRQWPYEDNGRDLDRQWRAILNDVTDTTGQVMLGLTIRCARCHDHKYDPILQEDYYRFQAYFAAMAPADDLPASPGDNLADYFERLRKWEEATRELRAERERLASPFQQQEEVAQGKIFPKHIQAMIKIAPEERTPYQRQLVVLAGQMLSVDPMKMANRMSGDVRKRWDELSEELAKFDDMRPAPPAEARGVRDIGRVAPPTHIPDWGTDDDIPPGILTVLDSKPAAITPLPERAQSTGRRAALARWIGSPANPLTARVHVNRLWQHHFGRGLVATAGDFGVLGDEPTHPELLDWLAAEFAERGYSVKHIHRLLVTSAAYRQDSTSQADSPARHVDAANLLLWRMNPRRVEAEVLRDGMLAAAGDLEFVMHGESIMPELPKDYSARYAWKPTPGSDQQNRRSIYLVVKRNVQLPLLDSFDLPDTHETCTKRVETTTPTQALVLLNDQWPLERAKALAQRLLDGGAVSESDLVRGAFLAAFSRSPDERELALGTAFLRAQAEGIRKQPGGGQKAPAPPRVPGDFERPLAAALVDYCHALFNANEFMYID